MFILFLVRFGMLSGQLLGNSCSLGSFVSLVISRFGFEGWIWVLIASVPDLCILFTFISLHVPVHFRIRQSPTLSLVTGMGNAKGPG